jgi:hypothetical protein
MLIAKLVSALLKRTNSYAVPFFVAGSAYLIALALIQGLVLRPKPVVVSVAQS